MTQEKETSFIIEDPSFTKGFRETVHDLAGPSGWDTYPTPTGFASAMINRMHGETYTLVSVTPIGEHPQHLRTTFRDHSDGSVRMHFDVVDLHNTPPLEVQDPRRLKPRSDHSKKERRILGEYVDNALKHFGLKGPLIDVFTAIQKGAPTPAR